MSEPLLALLKRAGHDAVLKAFGLDSLLSSDDDPALWAAAVARHWSAPHKQGLLFESLRFCTGKSGVQDSERRGRSGMAESEPHCFQRTGENQLRVIPCPTHAPPRLTIGGIGAMLGAFSAGAIQPASALPAPPSVLVYLVVSRPSGGAATAQVFVGFTAMPNLGSGETRNWRV